MISTQEFLDKYLWDSLSNDYWAQCVLLAKTFAKEVLWIQLWYFWWSAIAWFKNKHWTFDDKLWVKRLNTPDWIPEVWSLIFFEWKNFSQYGHVWIVMSAWINTVNILEQNGWTWAGTWTWTDAIRIQAYDYSWVVWWMTKRETVEYDFYASIEAYSESNIVVLYKWKYYINLNNTRVEVNENNFKSILV